MVGCTWITTCFLSTQLSPILDIRIKYMLQIPEILIIQVIREKPPGQFETQNDQHKIECLTVVPLDTVSNY